MDIGTLGKNLLNVPFVTILVGKKATLIGI
jgi:hypothetical protein